MCPNQFGDQNFYLISITLYISKLNLWDENVGYHHHQEGGSDWEIVGLHTHMVIQEKTIIFIFIYYFQFSSHD